MVHQLDAEEYGAVRSSTVPVQNSLRPSRTGMIALVMLMSMAAVLALLAGNVEQNLANSAIESMIVTPDDKLHSMIMKFASHGNSMTLTEMEQKLQDWRHDPSTMLDLPDKTRTQVDQEGTPVCFDTLKIISKATTVLSSTHFFRIFNADSRPHGCWNYIVGFRFQSVCKEGYHHRQV
jgi:hypothetical protein